MIEKTIKAPITVQANQALEKMLGTVNEGYLGGRVSKLELISWVLIEFEKAHISKSVEEIRKRSFDQLRYLESVVKILKESRKNGQAAPHFELPKSFDSVRKEQKA